MKEWIEEILTVLQSLQSSQHQFISATCVACCLQQCHISYNLKKLFPLMRMLRVQVDTESRTLPEYTCLCDLLVQRNFRYESCVYIVHIMHRACYVCVSFSIIIANAVGQLCQQAAKAGIKDANVDWLFILPLYHFMDGISDPFMPPEYDPERILFHTRITEIDWTLPQGLASVWKENTLIFH